MFCHFLLAHKVAPEKLADNFIVFALYATSCFPLAVFKIVSLPSAIFVTIYLDVGPWVHLVWNSLCLLAWVFVSFSWLGKFLAILSSNKLTATFLSSSSGITIMQMCVLGVVSETFKTFLIKKIFIFSVLFCWLPFRSLIHSSVLVNLWLIPSNIFSFHLLYFSVLLFFFFIIPSNSIEILSYVPLLHSSLSILITISLNSLSGKLPIFSLLGSPHPWIFCVPSFETHSSVLFCLTFYVSMN